MWIDKNRIGLTNARRTLLSLGLLLVGMLVLAACGGDDPTATPPPPAATATPVGIPVALLAVIEAAKGEGGTLGIPNQTVAGEPDMVDALAKGMTDYFGFSIKIDAVSGPSPSRMAPQLVEEYAAGKPAVTDVFVGDDVNVMPQIEGNSVMQIDWASLVPGLPDGVVGPDNAWLRLYTRIIGGISYNTDEVTPDNVPTSLNDLLDPQWKGRLATTSFVAGYREAAGLFGREQEILDFSQALYDSGNLQGFVRGGEVDRVASGEFAMYILMTGVTDTVQLKRKNAPIDFVVLPEMAIVSYWTVAVPKHSAHPNLATLFGVYMLTREAQDMWYKYRDNDLHLLPGSKTKADLDVWLAGIDAQFVTNQILVDNWLELQRVRPLIAAILRGE